MRRKMDTAITKKRTTCALLHVVFLCANHHQCDHCGKRPYEDQRAFPICIWRHSLHHDIHCIRLKIKRSLENHTNFYFIFEAIVRLFIWYVFRYMLFLQWPLFLFSVMQPCDLQCHVQLYVKIPYQIFHLLTENSDMELYQIRHPIIPVVNDMPMRFFHCGNNAVCTSCWSQGNLLVIV